MLAMTNRSNMVEVKVRSIFSGKMLTPGRPVSRILSGEDGLDEPARRRVGDHLSRAQVARRLVQPTRDCLSCEGGCEPHPRSARRWLVAQLRRAVL